ncbi:uncharacterized protein MONBRDRAFT_31918 [Monosiga brevicollis MX1]|uniref:Lipase maturation factor 2 n=1 Tax=Monosiga brevicollis TaxID=81824 RepID=A9UW95_MONBE|nr:uncharacterized protein MONBRDRAFT_31918 [Monosiga brevicollis MX1]EDQ90526.1 predicted protein [Monosiga brevicollis MX1]|eukprot:XP_001744577.1 hypothetical protein [Monosiga brevicollis MX1]
MMELLALCGGIFSVAALFHWFFRTKLVFLGLLLAYGSLYQVGQTFLHFQIPHHETTSSLMEAVALSTVGVYVVEIGLPFLFFIPSKRVRLSAGLAQAALMLFIFVTGNYNFFNILTAVLSIPLFYDTASIAAMHIYFGAAVFWDEATGLRVTTQIQFTKAQFATFVTQSMHLGIAVGVAGFALNLLFTTWSTLRRSSPLAGYRGWEYAQAAESWTRELSVVNSYGLFRRMTGVGGRPELTVEGSVDGRHWEELLFRYKPNRPQDTLPFLAPHQPRVDWQMWFAALGSIRQNVWLQSLAVRLLEGRPDVYGLLAQSQASELWADPSHPPLYVRIRAWTYSYTSTDQGNAWWKRELQEGMYLEPVNLQTHDSAIRGLMNSLGADLPVHCNNRYLCRFLKWLQGFLVSIGFQGLWIPAWYVVCVLAFRRLT